MSPDEDDESLESDDDSVSSSDDDDSSEEAASTRVGDLIGCLGTDLRWSRNSSLWQQEMKKKNKNDRIENYLISHIIDVTNYNKTIKYNTEFLLNYNQRQQ